MPVVNLDVDFYINKRFNRSFVLTSVPEFEEFQEILFEYGLELEKEFEELSNDEESSKEILKKFYKIDVPANRYDLLSGEGIARGIGLYLGLESPVFLNTVEPKGKYTEIHVKKSTENVRRYMYGAVLRNVKITRETYDSFIDLQEKLHVGLCRERRLASIGTHDLDTITGDIIYDALPPEDIVFTPLNQKDNFNGREIVKKYETDPKFKKFTPLIASSPMYPVVLDSKGRVLSLPPIINSDFSKITLNTKNIFIECTATDLERAKTAVDTLCWLFSEYCEKKYTVEPVKIVYEDGSHILSPNVAISEMDIYPEDINNTIGIDVSLQKIKELIYRMGFTSEISRDGNFTKVKIPSYRSDILSEYDIYGQIAVAYGFKNIEPKDVDLLVIGKEQPCSSFSQRIRNLMIIAGYVEILSFTLCSKDENSTYLRKKEVYPVVLSNPKSSEYEVVRTSLLQNLLKTLNTNQHHSLPMKIFEVSDVVVPVSADISDSLAQNRKHLCAIIAAKIAKFEDIHGLYDYIMSRLGINRSKYGYDLKKVDDPTFLENISFAITYKGQDIGRIGIIHPEVLGYFKVPFSCCALEIDCVKLIEDGVHLV